MVKGWADVSSDEEDFLSDDDIHDNEEIKAAALETMKREREEQKAAIRAEAEKAEAVAEAKAAKPREYQYPSQPPYTAYVGNVAYSITEWEDLANQLTALAKDLLDLELKITHTRIMMDRKDRTKHRGFAYVQVETLDMLKAFMQLNEKNAMIAGRKIQVDTSVRNNEPTEKRGASFRNNHNPHPRGGSFRNTAGENANKPPGQRTRLQLAPRTKPIEKDPNAGIQSNIFGSGKARNEGAEATKGDSSDAKKADGASQEFQKPQRRGDHQDSHRNSHKGRGGRHAGRGRGHNDRRQSHKDKDQQQNKGDQKQQQQKQSTARAPAKPVAETKPAEPAAPTNKFAALGFDSDSD